MCYEMGLEFDLRKVSARPIKSTLSRSKTLLSSRTLLLKPRILRKSKVILLSLGSRSFLCMNYLEMFPSFLLWVMKSFVWAILTVNVLRNALLPIKTSFPRKYRHIMESSFQFISSIVWEISHS
jgi:hypothetical protein